MSSQSEIFVPESVNTSPAYGDGLVPNKSGSNPAIYRIPLGTNQRIPAILVDSESGNVDIRSTDGKSFVKIDAQNKKAYLKDFDIEESVKNAEKLADEAPGLTLDQIIKNGLVLQDGQKLTTTKDGQLLINGKVFKGEKGEKGDSGKDGSDGRDGTNGLNGKDGIDGKDGSAGPQGKQGPQGDPGIDGKDGRNGADGLNGKDGSTGPQGEQGPQGNPGIDGKDGRNGVDGTNGRDGRDGIDGKNGKDGLKGDQGPQGIPGTSKFIDCYQCNEYQDEMNPDTHGRHATKLYSKDLSIQETKPVRVSLSAVHRVRYKPTDSPHIQGYYLYVDGKFSQQRQNVIYLNSMLGDDYVVYSQTHEFILSGLEPGVHKIELQANNSEEFRLKILDVGVSYL